MSSAGEEEISGKRVHLVEYDPDWPRQFLAEAVRLRSVLARDALAVEHIGSTAVPGLTAKPTLDIMIGVAALEEDRLVTNSGRLAGLGYSYDARARADEPNRWVFRKGPSDETEMRTHHLHVTALGGPYWRRILAFRDHLRSNEADAAAYVSLKRSLAERFASDRRSYTRAKGNFVVRIEGKALARRASQYGLPPP